MDQVATIAKALLHVIKHLQKDAGARDGFDEHARALKEIVESCDEEIEGGWAK
jgi:hypothetical protein